MKYLGRGMFAANVVAPRTNVKLAMIDPTTFPIPRSMSPLTAAVVETAISGMLVPKPTMIAPTTTADTPNLVAKSLEDSTKKSADLTSTTIPKVTNKRSMSILAYF